jgi:hypothetical protein
MTTKARSIRKTRAFSGSSLDLPKAANALGVTTINMKATVTKPEDAIIEPHMRCGLTPEANLGNYLSSNIKAASGQTFKEIMKLRPAKPCVTKCKAGESFFPLKKQGIIK